MKILKIALLFLLSFFILLFFVRALSPRELDDVNPGIQCDKQLIERSDVFWIIPFFENISISDNLQWIDYIQSKNKTLGMHGVQHTYEEFNTDKDFEYINNGIEIFEESFFEKPAIFKAPHLALNKNNQNLIESKGIEVKGKFNQITHKVYHCEDTGIFPNWIIRIF